MPANTEADILQRIIEPEEGDLSPHAARVLLSWRFTAADKRRMTQLSNKGSAGKLNADERRELEGYLLLGHLLAIAHSKARQSLHRRKPAA
jgi:hypothetical protein